MYVEGQRINEELYSRINSGIKRKSSEIDACPLVRDDQIAKWIPEGHQ